ncbi:hypothetical protein BZG36_00136 [Bifiguratus adelaidae]|uniref:BOD1/SHG1 domain-containing protein n=1 Tax=Bifiguratus adelaidae TaxID=1938954 RepID=A0A261Y8J9_9FUNG|nr:hypothetical protein BZG36_00136 [Bifiguratus adelaidae]
MTPDALLEVLKRKGVFDDVRRQMLADFSKGGREEQLLKQVINVMHEATTRDPSLLKLSQTKFQEAIYAEIGSEIFDQLAKDVIADMLQVKEQDVRIEEAIRSLPEFDLEEGEAPAHKPKDK